MTRLLIPDSGPLFSLAAGNLLAVLAHFRLGITDVVKQETIDKGRGPTASFEAKQLLKFYNANRAGITVMPTQVGQTLRALRLADPARPKPANAGELSIQSLLIHLQVTGASMPPVVLFEDSWFLRNQRALAKPCVLLSTEAFLINAEKLKLISSATKARAAISTHRPLAYSGVDSIDL
ncbi:MAG TPA: hypothetical protein VLJ58_04525 [Ramlibacter sp.]|nr:hypothetical protein [Ramlibacter sp.]